MVLVVESWFPEVKSHQSTMVTCREVIVLVFLKSANVWLVEYFGGLEFSNEIELGKMIFTPSYIFF